MIVSFLILHKKLSFRLDTFVSMSNCELSSGLLCIGGTILLMFYANHEFGEIFNQDLSYHVDFVVLD